MIELNLADFLLVLRELPLSEEHIAQLKTDLQGSRYPISDELADDLRDLCAHELDVSGFDANYKQTERGRQMDDLIDKLFVG